MKVYIIAYGSCPSDQEIGPVFSKREDALNYCRERNPDSPSGKYEMPTTYDVCEYDVLESLGDVTQVNQVINTKE